MKMKLDYSGVPAKIFPIIENAVLECGCVIWDISYGKRGADYVLEITIDNNEGANLDDCTNVHHAIDPLLDAADPIENSYTLEVSSPGVERALTMPWHFEVCEGDTGEIRLFAPLTEGSSKLICGTFAGYDKDAGAALINADGNIVSVPFADIASAKLTYDFTQDSN